jgi:hypothetical protein
MPLPVSTYRLPPDNSGQDLEEVCRRVAIGLHVQFGLVTEAISRRLVAQAALLASPRIAYLFS